MVTGMARRDERVALPDDGAEALPHSLHTHSNLIMIRKRKRPPTTATRKASPATFGRGTGYVHPDAPELFVFGKRVTEMQVVAQLRDLGGTALADYQSGRTSVESVYRATAAWLRQLAEIK
jgi:hypothetical protein